MPAGALRCAEIARFHRFAKGMVYIDRPSAAKYYADLVKFVPGAVPK